VVEQQQARTAILGWQRTVLAAYEEQRTLAMRSAAPPANFLDSAAGAVGEGVEDVVNGVASFGNAMIQNPGATVEMLAGGAMAAGGAALAGGGVLLDATGVGAVAGVPANVAGAAAMMTGAAAAADGARRLVDAASGVDQVQPMQVNWGNKSSERRAEEHQQAKDEHDRQAQKAHDWSEAHGGKVGKGENAPPPLFGWNKGR
jgi:hypothetical protein